MAAAPRRRHAGGRDRVRGRAADGRHPRRPEPHAGAERGAPARIVGASLAMPDIHWGYGFPIGGVAAMDADEGVVSPGGVGYDINCGVRLLRSRLTREQVAPRMREIVGELFKRVPTGVGKGRADLNLGQDDFDAVLQDGAAWAVRRGLGTPADLDHIEEGGCLAGADP